MEERLRELLTEQADLQRVRQQVEQAHRERRVDSAERTRLCQINDKRQARCREQIAEVRAEIERAGLEVKERFNRCKQQLAELAQAVDAGTLDSRTADQRYQALHQQGVSLREQYRYLRQLWQAKTLADIAREGPEQQPGEGDRRPHPAPPHHEPQPHSRVSPAAPPPRSVRPIRQIESEPSPIPGAASDDARSTAVAPPALAALAGPVGLGTVFQWLAEGLGRGLRHTIPLTTGALILLIVSPISMLMCLAPYIFVWPGLMAGLTLVALGAARNERGLFGKSLAGFTGGRLLPSMGVTWLLALIYAAASIPSTWAFFIMGGGALWYIVEGRAVGMVLLALLPLAYAPQQFLMSRLMWALPLVLDRRAGVVESVTLSWQLTGRVFHGFGTFVLVLLASLIGSVMMALILAVALATFAGGAAATIAAGKPDAIRYALAASEVDGMPRDPGETSAAYRERQVRELYRRMEAQLPERTVGERPEVYWSRATAELQQSVMSRPPPLPGLVGMLAGLVLTVPAVICVVCGAALLGVLWVPGMVGYRDMCAPAAFAR